MKVAQHSIHTRSTSLPEIKFAPQDDITSFGGLVVLQVLFARLDLWERLSRCCRHLTASRQYRHAIALRCLIVHLMLGFRELRHADAYAQDPMIKRTLGLKRQPSVPTISRLLTEFDPKSIAQLGALNRELISARIEQSDLRTLTLDFDGSVLSTKRHAEGSAVGFNKQKKGARSYYPLLCTIAQTGQVYSHLHRSGNVHDSNGAIAFVKECLGNMRKAHPKTQIEVRMDSAFFSDAMITALEALNVLYTISVPFERFVELKGFIEHTRTWKNVPGLDEGSHHCEKRWKPKSWAKSYRFLFFRKLTRIQRKEPLQLDLFRPVAQDIEFKVIITNKTTAAGNVVAFHEGRGYQEKIFGEMKQDVHMGYVPCRRLAANQVWMQCAILAHNLGREMQMEASPPQRNTTAGRTVRWVFSSLSTLRRLIIQRAGRLTRPQGKLTLTLADIPALRAAISGFMPKRA